MLGNLFKARSKTKEAPVKDKTDQGVLSRRMRGVLGRDQHTGPTPPVLAPEYLAPLTDVGGERASAEMIEEAAETVRAEAETISTAPPEEAPVEKPRTGIADVSLADIRAEIEERLEALRAERQAMPAILGDEGAGAEPEPLPAPAAADAIASLDPAGEGESDGASGSDDGDALLEHEAEPVDDHEVEVSRSESANDSHASEVDPLEAAPTVNGDETVQPITVVYLSPEAMDDDDPARANELSAEVVNYLLFEAGYRSEEIAREAFCAWCVNLYHGEVQAGGMTQFIHNATGHADVWEGCRDGLEMIGASAHLAVFDAMTRLLAENAGLADALADASSDPEATAAIADVDQAFAEANEEETLTEMTGAWLRGLSNLVILDADALQEEVTALADRAGLASRRARMARDD